MKNHKRCQPVEPTARNRFLQGYLAFGYSFAPQQSEGEEPMNMLGLGLKGPCGLISGLKVIKASVAQTVGSGCKRPLWLKLWF